MGNIRNVLIDIDGCFYRGNLKESGLPLTTWFEDNNETVLDYLFETNKNFAENIFSLGTNRQSAELDIISFMGRNFTFANTTAAVALTMLESAFSSDAKNTHINPLLMADIFSTNTEKFETTIGRNYQHMFELLDVKDYFEHGQKVSNYDQTVFDKHKISLLYAHIHEVARQYPNDDITVEFFDDQDDILKVLHQFFGSHPEFMPDNVSLKLHTYSEYTFDFYEQEICGTGKIDYKYDWTVRYMAATASTKEGEDLTKLTKQKIEEFSVKQRYDSGVGQDIDYCREDYQLPRQNASSDSDIEDEDYQLPRQNASSDSDIEDEDHQLQKQAESSTNDPAFTTEEMLIIQQQHLYQTEGSVKLAIEAEDNKNAIAQLDNFRNSVATELKSTLPEVGQKYYTTAQQLKESGLITQDHLYPSEESAPLSMLFTTEPSEEPYSKNQYRFEATV